MSPSPIVTVRLDADRLRDNARRIRQRTGVALLAVVKADAYGLGARRVAPLIADLVDGFCVFALREAIDADLWHLTGKPIIALGPPDATGPADYLAHHVRPAVFSVEQARALRRADPIVCIDTGMQRLACPAELVADVAAAGACREAFTHATHLDHVRSLKRITREMGLRLHAAASALLNEPEAYLDAVRPGLALYDGAVTVRTTLVEVHDTRGPAGYTGFAADRHGIILAGYSHGLRRGLCLVNGHLRRIPEVGMQTAYVEIGPDDRPGDQVLLLGPHLPPESLAAQWGAPPHEVLLRLAQAGSHQSP